MIRTLILAVAAAAAPLAAADTWTVDPVHTWAQFKVKHMGAGFSIGRFNTIAGTVQWDVADPTKSAISVTIETASVDTGRDKASQARDEHLRGPDFLSAKEFPAMTFTSTAIAKTDKADTWTVTGNFSLRGVTKPVTVTLVKTGQAVLPAQAGANAGKPVMGFDATFAISRKEFGMTYGEGAVGDEVAISVSTEVIGPK